MTNDQRLKEIEAVVTRIEGVLTKMAKPAVWHYDADHMTDDGRDLANKLSESMRNTSVTIETMEAVATASQVAELKAMVEKLAAEKAADGYDVWRVPLGRVDPSDDLSPTNMEWAATLVKGLQDGGLSRSILLVPQVYCPGADGPIDGGWKFERMDGSPPKDVVADAEFLKKMEEAMKTGGTVTVDAPEGGIFRLPSPKVDEPKPEVEPTTTPVVSQPQHGKKRKH